MPGIKPEKNTKSSYKTRQKDLLLSYLCRTHGRHFTAEDIYSHFEKKGIAIGIATIYRQLDKFVEQGIVLKYFIDEHSASCFEYVGENSLCAQDVHFHLKCEKCGRLTHLECKDLASIKNHLLKKHGFLLNTCKTVFYGLCQSCLKNI